MSIRVFAEHQSFPLHTPFRISRGVRTAAEVVYVEILDGEHVGRGEAAPNARYEETPDTCLAEIREIAPEIEAGLTRAQLQSRLKAGSARNALDCAMWDLELKSGRASLPPLPARMHTAITISIDEPEAMARAAAAVRDAPVIKVKTDDRAPAAQVEAVAKAAPKARLIIDPNESWSVDILRELEPLLSTLNVGLLEQPVPADDDEQLEGYRASAPIAADEAAHVTADLERLKSRYQAVNLKLDKTGGLTEALAMIRKAEAMGFVTMIGCMMSTSLSMVPAMHIAARTAFADLDGPFWLAEDRDGGIGIRDGLITPAAPGFWG